MHDGQIKVRQEASSSSLSSALSSITLLQLHHPCSHPCIILTVITPLWREQAVGEGSAPEPGASSPHAPVPSSGPHDEGDIRHTSKRRRPSGGAALEDRASITASSPSAAQGDGSPSGTGQKRARTTGAATASFSNAKNDAYKDRFNNIATRRGGNIAAMEVVPGQSLCWRDSQRRARGTRGTPRRGCGPESGWPGDCDMC